ncbi:MAG: hypothetical protein AAF798_21000 [Bacteroidota bacterium]
MPTTLSNKEITYLTNFIRRKGVAYEDLQVELIDHFATKLEQEHTYTNFEAFQLEVDNIYASFKDKEFEQLVKERKDVLVQKYMKMFWRFMRGFFSWPKIALVIGLVALVNVLLYQVVDFKWFFRIHYIAYVVATLGMLAYVYLIKTPRNKSYLFIDAAKKVADRVVVPNYLFMLFLFLFLIDNITMSPLVLSLFSFYMVAVFLFHYAGMVLVQQKALEEFEQFEYSS